MSESRRTDKEKVLRSDHGSGSVSESRGGRIQDADFGGEDEDDYDDVMKMIAIMIRIMIMIMHVVWWCCSSQSHTIHGTTHRPRYLKQKVHNIFDPASFIKLAGSTLI